MKQKTITTDKATLLVVECPKTYSLFHDEDWQLIGRLPDITEEQAGKVVDYYELSHNLDLTVTLAYKDYVNGISEEDNVDYDYWDEYPFDTAIESLHSILQANEVCFENRELKWKTFDTEEKYKQAQSKVWDKERTYLFKKI